MNNKKRNKIILIYCGIALLILICICVLGVFAFALRPQENTKEVVVDGKLIDNDINNSLCGNNRLLRLDDKIYFDLYSDGLYELSERGSRRLKYGGGFFGGTMGSTNYFLAKINGELYCQYNNSIKKYDPETEKFVSQNEFSSISSIALGDIVVDVKYPLWGDRAVSFVYKGETLKTHKSEDYTVHYISGEYIYYSFDLCEIRRFNVVSKSDELVIDVGNDEKYIENIIVENGKLIYVIRKDDSTDICYFQLDDENKTIRTIKIDTSGSSLRYNVFDNKLFVGANDTLTKYDLITGENQALVEKEGIDDIYIVDDKWVYFTAEDDEYVFLYDLWRITQDGSVMEKVLG